METSTNWEKINKQINKIDKKINKSYKDFENFVLKRPLLACSRKIQSNELLTSFSGYDVSFIMCLKITSSFSE